MRQPGSPLWIRALDAFELTPLAGTDNAVDPFWSPDSRFIAFFADARLKKIDRSGGRCRRSAMRSEPWVELGIDPVPVAQQIAVGTNSNWLASSNSGVLAYISGQSSRWQYVWRDRQGRNLGALIAEALAVAHARGIIHRDLKPGNIVTKSGEKVLDFGLAKSAADPALTAKGGVMGTPAYMTPERFEGREADARSDIYSLGLVLSEMATGKRLEAGFAASQTILPAQETSRLEGIWSVSVNVTNCQTGAPIRTVASLQAFRHDGSEIETANTASRGISEGVWGYAGDHTVAALYWFYRHNPDGTFASRANVTDKIVLGIRRRHRLRRKWQSAHDGLLLTHCHPPDRRLWTAGDDWQH